MTVDTELIPEILPVDARLAVSGDVAAFIDVLSRVSKVLPAKEIIPGTAHVLIDAREQTSSTAESLRVTATDGVNTVSAIDGSIVVRAAGKALIPGVKFLAILKLAPTASFGLQVIGNEALIRSGQSQWRVQLSPGDSLPDTPAFSLFERHDVPRERFLWALEAANRSASHIQARASLMQVHVKDGCVTGMDGNRIHRAFFDGGDDLEISIPVGTCQELIRMLKASEDSHVGVGSYGRHMMFAVDRDYLVSSSLLTDFPETDPLLVRASMITSHELTADVAEMKAAVARVRVNADPDFSAISLVVCRNREGKWGLSIRAQDRQRNSAQEFIGALWTGPKEIRELIVSHKNLMDFLDSFPSAEVTFKVGEDTQSSKTPLLAEDDGKFIGLIQQMRSDYLD